MKLLKLAAAVAVSVATVAACGCSSEGGDKTPKAAGPIDPNLKPAGRSAPGGGGPAPKTKALGGVQTKGAITKD